MSAQQVSLHRGGMPRRSGNQLSAFGQDFDELFRNFFEDLMPQRWASDIDITAPSTDVIETDRDVRICAEVPGMTADDISITINEGYVSIKGEKREESEEDTEGYYRRERSFGEFRRVIALPPNTVNTDNAEATLDKGVLTITIPKRSETQAKTHRLEVKQGEGSQRQGAEGRKGESRTSMRHARQDREGERMEGRSRSESKGADDRQGRTDQGRSQDPSTRGNG